jgi:hypothetical protein
MFNPIRNRIKRAYQAGYEKAKAEYETTKVNRVEVIDDTNGRAYVNYDAYNVIVQLQDSGRTLKVFIGN